MIAVLGRHAPPDEAVALRALAAGPLAAPEATFRRVGQCLLGMATHPDFADSSISADGDIIAVLDGRIDNASDLWQGHGGVVRPPASPNDADVVVAAFRTFGPDVVNRFRGAFAGAVSDGRSLWCFRDHVGFKPLFYRSESSSFIASGDARSVVVASDIPEEPDFKVVEQIFYGWLPSDTPAALKGVSRLPQGTHLKTGIDSAVTTHRYWQPHALLETARLSGSDARDRFLELLAQGVRRSVTGEDVVLLSGGLDSPAVAAYAAPEHQRRSARPLGALSVVFPDLPDVDERPYIELVAKRFGMTLHTYTTSARALDDVEQWSRRFATPVPTLSIPEVWEAYTRARSLGYRNVLTGEFAELVYGKWLHQLPHLLWHGRLGALARVIQDHHLTGASRRELLFDTLTAFVPGRVVNWSLVRRGKNEMHKAPPWIDRNRYDPRTPRPDYMVPARDRWRALQLWGTQGSTVTMEADATCAAMAGVTIRRPIADIDLWEFFLSLRAEVKFPVLHWKALAKRALRGVIPDEIIDRKKKTVFDQHVMQQVDYPALERLLVQPRHRIPGVNYELLAQRIAGRELAFHEWLRARELARMHAFLNAW